MVPLLGKEEWDYFLMKKMDSNVVNCHFFMLFLQNLV